MRDKIYGAVKEYRQGGLLTGRGSGQQGAGLARNSHQFKGCQVQSFWQITIVGYFFCQNTEEDDAAWAAPRGHFLQGTFGEHCVKIGNHQRLIEGSVY
jgi:hypothetical protein